MTQDGYRTILKDYQEYVMHYLWSQKGKGITSGKAWVEANKELLKEGKSKSRASIIFFLQDMSAAGYLTFTMATGKGGHHRVYTSLYTETEFRGLIAKQVIDKLLETFPEETERALIKTVEDLSTSAGK